MSISIYRTRSFALRTFTDLQRDTLIRAGEWSPLDYVFVHSAHIGKPTQTNAEIAHQIRKYQKLTHMGVLHPVYCHPAQTFFVRNPKPYEADATAPNIEVALECASQQFRCDIVTIKQGDFQEHFTEFAARWRVLMLVI